MLYSESLYEIFRVILQMSFAASIVIFVVMIVRFFMKKMPKIFSYMLWGIALFRLLCPISFFTPVSVFQIFDTEDEIEVTITEQTYYYDEEGIPYEAVAQSSEPVEEVVSHSYIPNEVGKITIPWDRIIVPVGWLAGMTVFFIYGIISYIKLKKTLIGAVQEKGNIYLSDYIQSPFVLGEIPPKIYLPSNLEQEEKEYILLHEQIHIKRGDHIFRLLAFIALAVHWFNPLVWQAFKLSGMDMEMSCDEAVMRKTGKDIREEYASSLLKIAVGKHVLPIAFLAFGEDNTKSRIKNIMNYKKHTAIITVAAMIIVAFLVVTLGSNPTKDDKLYTAASGVTTTVYVGETENTVTEYIQNGEVKQENTEKEAYIEEQLHRWAQAFCDRDGETIFVMSSKEARNSLEESVELSAGKKGVSLGWSSPWPWDSQKDYRIAKVEEGKATILYYAWVSDPHVTVWAEHIEFEVGDNTENKDNFQVTESNLVYMQDISNPLLFNTAYEKGINNTPMDYLTNGAGEALNENALSNRNVSGYEQLFELETAVIYLLNLNADTVDIDVNPAKEDGSVVLAIMFHESGEADSREVCTIKMVQPFGKDGIWIPQDDTDIGK